LQLNYRVPFDQLNTADLFIDAIYQGGKKGNVTDDPISKLMGCGNQGGFRIAGKAPSYRFAVLYSSLDDPDWPDYLDFETGLFYYYGDNKQPGYDLHSKKGNRLLKHVFNLIYTSKTGRSSVPPFFIFIKGPQGRDVVFRGLAAPGTRELPPTENLVAIWKNKDGFRFQNYKAVFTILDVPALSRSWLNDIKNGNVLSNNCPAAWRRWVKTGIYTPLRAPRSVEYRSKGDQLPATNTQKDIVDCIYYYFKDDPYAFEKCAAEIARLMDPNITGYDLTRRWMDGGRDATGKYRIGLIDNAIIVDFALEAKCFSIDNPVKVEHTSRLVSRLRYRQFGILVTTSYVSQQAYKEIKEDRHPVIIICAADIANILTRAGLGSKQAVNEWLTENFPKDI
jgi:hypothetical protein